MSELGDSESTEVVSLGGLARAFVPRQLEYLIRRVPHGAGSDGPNVYLADMGEARLFNSGAARSDKAASRIEVMRHDRTGAPRSAGHLLIGAVETENGPEVGGDLVLTDPELNDLPIAARVILWLNDRAHQLGLPDCAVRYSAPNPIVVRAHGVEPEPSQPLRIGELLALTGGEPDVDGVRRSVIEAVTSAVADKAEGIDVADWGVVREGHREFRRMWIKLPAAHASILIDSPTDAIEIRNVKMLAAQIALINEAFPGHPVFVNATARNVVVRDRRGASRTMLAPLHELDPKTAVALASLGTRFIETDRRWFDPQLVGELTAVGEAAVLAGHMPATDGHLCAVFVRSMAKTIFKDISFDAGASNRRVIAVGGSVAATLGYWTLGLGGAAAAIGWLTATRHLTREARGMGAAQQVLLDDARQRLGKRSGLSIREEVELVRAESGGREALSNLRFNLVDVWAGNNPGRQARLLAKTFHRPEVADR